jgi:hypothetical protein
MKNLCYIYDEKKHAKNWFVFKMFENFSEFNINKVHINNFKIQDIVTNDIFWVHTTPFFSGPIINIIRYINPMFTINGKILSTNKHVISYYYEKCFENKIVVYLKDIENTKKFFIQPFVHGDMEGYKISDNPFFKNYKNQYYNYDNSDINKDKFLINRVYIPSGNEIYGIFYFKKELLFGWHIKSNDIFTKGNYNYINMIDKKECNNLIKNNNYKNLIRMMDLLEIDFCRLDITFHDDKMYVLDVNTHPGFMFPPDKKMEEKRIILFKESCKFIEKELLNITSYNTIHYDFKEFNKL